MRELLALFILRGRNPPAAGQPADLVAYRDYEMDLRRTTDLLAEAQVAIYGASPQEKAEATRRR